MRKEDLKVGMKVVPFQKTAYDWMSWEGFKRYDSYDFLQQNGYLIVGAIYEDDIYLDDGSNGGRFNLCDFEPYIETTTETIIIKYKGNKTTAILSSGKKASVKLQDGDTYDKPEGMFQAIAKVLGKDINPKTTSAAELVKSAISFRKFDAKTDWVKFLSGEIAVNCQMEDKANEFLGICDKLGIEWVFEKLLPNSEWNIYKDETCYQYEDNSMKFDGISCFKEEEIEIVIY